MKSITKTLIAFLLIFSLSSQLAYSATTTRNGFLTFTTAAAALGVGIWLTSLFDKDSSNSPDEIDLTVNNIHFTESGPSGRQDMILKNNSAKDAVIDSIDFVNGAGDGRVEIIEQCTLVPAHGECTVKLEAKHNAYDGSATIYYDGSSNIQATIKVDLTKHLALSINSDADDLHLGYRSLKLKNTIQSPDEGEITITDINLAITGDHAANTIHCNQAELICNPAFKTNCSGKTLEPDGSCLLWFKAENNGIADLYKYEDIRISIEATGNLASPNEPDKPVSTREIFNVTTDQALYAAGDFNYVTKYDGSNWAKLGGDLGPSGVGKALLTRNNTGDIYLGGDFTSPASYMARWNGETWSAVSNQPNSSVKTITDNKRTDNANIIYAGGTFTSPSNLVTQCNVNDVCSDIINNFLSGTEVNALAQGGNYLYIGGNYV